MKSGWVGVAIYGIVGMAFLAAGVFWSAESILYLHNSVAVSGQVVSVEMTERSDLRGQQKSDLHRPVFLFTDESGAQHQAATRYNSSKYDYAIGELVEIRYTPKDLSVVRVNRGFSFWGAPVVVMVLSFKFLGIAFIKQHGRRTRHPKPKTAHVANKKPDMDSSAVIRRRK